MLFGGVPLGVIVDITLDRCDKRREVNRTRFSLSEYLFAILVLLVLSGPHYIVL